jgi:methionine-rich copper-binding protein CopC
MRLMRRSTALLLAGSLALLPTTALAHTELTTSDPADGATITEAPVQVVLTFAGELDEAAAFTVLDPDGEEVGTGALDLEVADRNVIRGDVEVSAVGEYTVAWSVIGDDGHEVEGEVVFTYDPEGEATTPDTALPIGPAIPMGLVGMLLVVLAVTMSVRRTLAVRG